MWTIDEGAPADDEEEDEDDDEDDMLAVARTDEQPSRDRGRALSLVCLCGTKERRKKRIKNAKEERKFGRDLPAFSLLCLLISRCEKKGTVLVLLISQIKELVLSGSDHKVKEDQGRQRREKIRSRPSCFLPPLSLDPMRREKKGIVLVLVISQITELVLFGSDHKVRKRKRFDPLFSFGSPRDRGKKRRV